MSDPLSFQNPKIQRLRRLLGRRSARRDDGALVIEGASLITEAIAAGWEIEAEFLGPGAEPVTNAVSHQLAAGVLERLSTTETPQPNVAVARIPAEPVDLSGCEFVLVADRIADPGNLGTVLRSAEAAGADAVLITPGTVDPSNPKVVRASAGARFHVPIMEADLGVLVGTGLRRIGTSSHRGTLHTEADLRGRIALIVGSEARGLDETVEVDEWVRIAHHGRAESLNVAMAATVLCFEVARSRAR